MWQNPLETADLVTYTEEILNEKLFLSNENKYFLLAFWNFHLIH